MKPVVCLLSACVIAAAAGPSAARADAGKTRAQVYAELIAARQAGEIRQGEDADAPRDQFPSLYPAAGPEKTRAQVRAEFRAALRSGEVSTGQQGFSPRELNPGAYPAGGQARDLAHSSAPTKPN